MVFFRKTEEERPPKPAQELADLRAAVQRASLPEAVAAVARKELERLDKTDPSVAEYTIGLNYLDFLISLPWNRVTEDNLDLKRAERLLEAQHYGLNHVKERILEYLAVRTLCSLQTSQVLVVDDEEIARTNLEYILRKEGHQVSTAANGLEALEKVKAQEFDVVLTDLKMEKMDGLQLLESVKQIAPHTEIIMVTGYATVSTAVDALKKGAAHYLSKPIKLDELRATVREIVEKKRHLQMCRGPILCFAGPPGVGKTSIGRSIAEALERKFVRLSLAGLRDEAELRGHRRTYVGAMPGRIINELKRLEVRNPVFMLDEIDKIGQDFRGDPASVLLEILDPEQNSNFVDHYLDVPFDLSGAMFITTANVVEKLPGPLAGPPGGHLLPRLHRGRKGQDRQKLPHPPATAGAQPAPPGPRVHRRRRRQDHSAITPGRRASGTWSGKSPMSAASWPASASRTRANPAPSPWTRSWWRSSWAPASSSMKWPRPATRWA